MKFTYVGGIVQYRVPTTGVYDISAIGASGGSTPSAAGGSAAATDGLFTLTAGDLLYILVGGMGTSTTNADTGAGGGGGSFVYDNTTHTLLEAAGGGGGAGSGLQPAGGAAVAAANGIGEGGAANSAGGGGGYSSDGNAPPAYTNDPVPAQGGKSFIDGGRGGGGDVGGTSGSGVAGGAGGGGGGGEGAGGGGGGYSGGQGGGTRFSGGSGGGSFDAGVFPTLTAGANVNGNGSATITPLPNETILTVGTEQQLNQAIATADHATSGTYIIVFSANITEGTDTGAAITFGTQTLAAPPDLYAIDLNPAVSLTIDGNAFSLNGNNQYRGFFAYAGTITIDNLSITATTAHGGNGGGSGGGGGAGLGGGLFVAGPTQGAGAANVTLNNVSFSGNAATGGNGGAYGPGASGDAGGGGGLGGNGGNSSLGASGGGGGLGSSAHGGNGAQAGGVGIIPGVASGGGAGGSDSANGGVGPTLLKGGFGGGGGGGGVADSGGFGGGGGGGNGAGGSGGAGGFGGGGGGANGFSSGAGGYGAGRGSAAGGGGGGLGAGGDVFVQQGGSLTIVGGALAAGTVKGGAGGANKPAGQAGSGTGQGSAIFLQGNDVQTLEAAGPTAAQALVVSGTIADDSGHGGLIIAGDGTVSLSGANSSFGSASSGGITIDNGATLLLNAPGAAGNGHIAFAGTGAALAVTQGDTPTNALTGLITGDIIDLLGIGTATSATVSGHTLSVTGGATPVSLNLDPAVSESTTFFQTSADGAGGTDLTALVDTATMLYADDEASLNAAIAKVNAAAPGSYTIKMLSNIKESTSTADGATGAVQPLYAISLRSGVTLTLDGGGYTLDGGGYAVHLGSYTLYAGGSRGLFVNSGSVAIDNLTIADAQAHGGAGAGGGGGGAGLGGGLFIRAGATVTLSGTQFVNDAAIGGQGALLGDANTRFLIGGNAGGGGGGLGGSGTAGNYAANNYVAGHGGGTGVANVASTGGAGSDNTISGASPTGHVGGFGVGGGGGGTTVTYTSGTGGIIRGLDGVGGAGGFGGGGGGGTGTGSYAPGSTGNTYLPDHAVGGKGGFGGGGGAGNEKGAAGGSGGGAGNTQTGGGGLGAGGDIFVQQGGNLIIDGGTITPGGVVGGSGANSGSALGSALALNGQSATLAPSAGNTVTITGGVADAGGAGALVVNGQGSVVLSGANSYSGGTDLKQGTLTLTAAGAAGSGPITFSGQQTAQLQFNANNVPTESIAGLSGNNTSIDLLQFSATSVSLGANDVLTVKGTNNLTHTANQTISLSLAATAGLAQSVFGLYSDGANGTLLTVNVLPVFTEQQLNQAIALVDAATAGTYAITLGNTIAEGTDTGSLITYAGQSLSAPADLYAINLKAGVRLTIEGNGAALNGAGAYRGLLVYSGNVTLQDLTIENAVASGGSGTHGGGGGAGLGGGLFVAGSNAGSTAAQVTLSNVTFTNNSAAGGAGGSGSGGGGGGLGGNAAGGGGGGVGAGASGGHQGVVLGANNNDGGGGAQNAGGGVSPSGATGGFGGGGGTTGAGGFGGGAAGGNDSQAAGGFGGGGSGNYESSTPGGFGAGAGVQGSIPYSNGTGGIVGSQVAGTGGGGLGAGGDVFVQQGARLTIEGGTLGTGSVAGGSGGNAGSAFGQAIFFQGTTTQTFAPALGQVLTIAGTIADQGGNGGSATVVVDGLGTVQLQAANSYAGGTTLSSGTLTLSVAGATGSGAITFTGNGVLAFGAAATPTTMIDGLLPGQGTLDITGVGTASSAKLGANNVLTVTEASASQTVHLDPAHSYAGDKFAVTTDAAGGTLVTAEVACYCAGTLILTDRGETPVEALAIGDRVVTASGATEPIRWIGQRSYAGRFIAGNHLMLPVCVRAGALANGVPRQDLWVSPGHAMHVDGQLVPAWRLVNGVTVTQAETVEDVTYFHVELHRHDLLLANGAAAESFLDETGFRGQFHNAAAFYAAHPEAAPLEAMQKRLEDGFALQRIQERLATRARLWPAIEPAGALRGFVDQARPDQVCGWAQDLDSPEEPVAVEVLVAGTPILCLLANGWRADLRQAGIGSGCHAFSAELPPGLSGPVVVRRVVDGAVLAQTEPAKPAARHAA